ncbi:gamma-glutamyltransferase family protein [Aspergillus clavatus NRRL 1]|uniref:Gamma-glutamyltranspeptidase n=1 Tax=Aspergillus clavatus (strain ATCC 1007 / CBS 513.65 / DSM 816 / NCTC 3887 / NRRL 1 / QM 1276 / 107) TaxID=344612 RepID=A1CIT0_ASPCL|nr:gamma-glutamyltranspeptidase [Aspergillus clavatus NRRL 1]EAW10785.1 gamma-glutamyltranspeptidase [Aspergillus clavatus NRRL 1]
MPLNPQAVYSRSRPDFAPFASRRSTVHSTNGIVSCTQPLAAAAGQRILMEGGNAADAAVAVAAALNVSEPSSTGIGGDMFCLFYEAKTKKVHSLNGSGRYPGNVTLEQVRKDLNLGPDEKKSIPMPSVLAATTPGAAAGWVDTVERFGSGKLSLEQILAPAIDMAEKGFIVSELASYFWQEGEELIRNASPNFRELLKPDPNAKDGVRSPRPGEIMKKPGLAKVFRLLAAEGKKGFYEGPVAEAIVQVVKDLGGYLSLDDLKYHAETGSQETEAISLKFTGQDIVKKQTPGTDGETNEGVEIWEHPPNGQGIVALMALGILEELERTGKIPLFTEDQHNSTEYLHAIIESLRIAFADAAWWVTDPDVEKVPSKELISREYLAERAKLFNPEKAADIVDHGSPAHNHCDTVYLAVTDKEGNGISFINSTYSGFGTGIIPQGCGFTLQNRGANFSLDPGHPNALAPRKRPYHTIIPAMITNCSDGSLHSVYGVMGGFMQPQGHVQVLLNMVAFNYHPQAALDAPRICIAAGSSESGNRTVYVEEGISEETVEGLKRLGHEIQVLKGWERGMFGRGQVIRCHHDDGHLIYSAGSDPRGDGMSIPVV